MGWPLAIAGPPRLLGTEYVGRVSTKLFHAEISAKSEASAPQNPISPFLLCVRAMRHEWRLAYAPRQHARASVTRVRGILRTPGEALRRSPNTNPQASDGRRSGWPGKLMPRRRGTIPLQMSRRETQTYENASALPARRPRKRTPRDAGVPSSSRGARVWAGISWKSCRGRGGWDAHAHSQP